MAVKAYLEVTMRIPAENRKAAAKVYSDYRKPFLETIPGAESKALLVRDEDVQVFTRLWFSRTCTRLSKEWNVYQACFSRFETYLDCWSRS